MHPSIQSPFPFATTSLPLYIYTNEYLPLPFNSHLLTSLLLYSREADFVLATFDTTVLDWDGLDSTQVPGAAQVLPVLPRAADAPLHRVEVLRHSHTPEARRRQLRRLTTAVQRLEIRVLHHLVMMQ